MQIRRRHVPYILIFAVAAMILVELSFSLFESKERKEARRNLQELSELTLQIFPTGQPAVREIFWRAVGRSEPLKDPWGTYYDISLGTKRQDFVWRSAGPDKILHTNDDLELGTLFNPPNSN